MNMNENRRKVIKNLIAGSVAMGSSSILTACATDNKKDTMDIKLKGNINHSVCQWCYGFISLEELCKAVKEIGFGAIDLIQAKDGSIWFLEINSNGQWGFVEWATGQQIGKAMVQLLKTGKN